MIKNLFALPDGSALFSGDPQAPAIRQVRLTRTVNPDRELVPGGVCAAMVEAELFVPGGFSLAPGTELTLFHVTGQTRTQVGVFLTETPEKTGPNTYRLTAFDRMSLLDRDIGQWLWSLTGWPYRLAELAQMVCHHCGLTLATDTLPNGDYLVNAFSGEGITGRQVMAWIAQAAGRFCRATPTGEVEFAWWRPTDILVGPRELAAPEVTATEAGEVTITGAFSIAGTAEAPVLDTPLLRAVEESPGEVTLRARSQYYYCQNSLTCGDYTVAPVEKVQIHMTDEDVGAVWPDDTTARNTLRLTGNYLLTTAAAAALEPVARTIYEQMEDMVYTPCAVTVSVQVPVEAGDILTVLDPQGREMTVYAMACVTAGQQKTITCTGSPSRDSTRAVNAHSYRALTGRVLNLRADVEGLKAENRDAAGARAGLFLDVEGIRTEVARQQTQAEGLQQQLTGLSQTAEGIAITVRSALEAGANRVRTREKNYTLDDTGLTIAGEKGMTNLLDETGMQVSRSGENILQATDEGVKAIDITVKNYLHVGSFARFENYTDGTDSSRTACFWTEGG